MVYKDGKIYTLGGVQTKQVDQFDVESGKWANQFIPLSHFRVAHGVVSYDVGLNVKTRENCTLERIKFLIVLYLVLL